jgi:hypothetical protein
MFLAVVNQTIAAGGDRLILLRPTAEKSTTY